MNMRIRIVLFLVLCLHPLSSPAQSFGGPIRPYPFTCYVSEQTSSRSGSPPPGTWIAPDAQNVLVPGGGAFVDRLGYQRFGGTFTRNQVIHAHRNRDGFGIPCRVNILTFDGDDIVATPNQP